MELTEAIRVKDKEAEAYISEIEVPNNACLPIDTCNFWVLDNWTYDFVLTFLLQTIGQAYEDMQTQNQHLLQQVTERDDYNIKLVSESVKTKQVQSFLLSEKQALAKQLQQVNTSVESLKMRISHGEEQVRLLLCRQSYCIC